MPTTPMPGPDASPIGGATRVLFVLGNPVVQVQAPAVMNPLLARAGIDAVVVPLELEPQGLEATVRGLLDGRNVAGMLVTVPYKQMLFPLCDTHGPEASLARAVNALRVGSDGRIAGELFDGIGFVEGLRAAGHDPAGRRVLLVGAGGAGSAIAVALADAGVASLRIHDPAGNRSRELAASLASRYPGRVIEPIAQPDPRGHDIVVNATPLGMRDHDPLPVDTALLDAANVVAEVIMKPADTRLLQAARARGCATHAGRHMLEHQLPAYLRFFGFEPALPFAIAQLAAARAASPA